MNIRNFFFGRSVVFVILLLVLALIGAFYALNSYMYEQKQAYAAKDHKNAEYTIDGQRVRLVKGSAETEAAPGSASKVTTRYFGNEVATDLNDDGRMDVVFLLTSDTGGSGIFYYAVAALNTERGYIGSEGFLLGDRIAPQTTEKGTGKIVIVNFADRSRGQDFTVPPSIGKSVWLLLDPETMRFGIVEPNFEGEADPARMSLDMKTWTWVSALFGDGRELKPTGPKAFTITFGKDGNFSATTDCNSMGGKYMAKADKTISFSNIFSTKMYCEGSKESDFASLLENAQMYHFTSKGELILNLKFDSGSAVFR